MAKIALKNPGGQRGEALAVYDEKSPITGNYSVLAEYVDAGDEADPKQELYKVCMDTGYQTYWDSWKTTNTELINSIELSMPKTVINNKFIDSNGHIWYPLTIVSYLIALYPIMDSNNQLKWSVSNVSLVEGEDDMDGRYQILKLPVMVGEEMQAALFKLETPIQIWELNQFEKAFDFYQELSLQKSLPNAFEESNNN